ncbi:hypothetical protein EYF80_056176 [Liparis tanakae]|uniref:Uncharacterized protein n=1 Tax=Liparis tanakae TaxID=230148 RepID=A0A4Z2EXS2_9TELE|nr:hypothetical protein EYF80_056176 [Liparis tanakae]
MQHPGVTSGRRGEAQRLASARCRGAAFPEPESDREEPGEDAAVALINVFAGPSAISVRAGYRKWRERERGVHN